MKWRTTEWTINFFLPIGILLSLWLGFTGRVDWWVIIFVWVIQIQLSYTWKK